MLARGDFRFVEIASLRGRSHASLLGWSCAKSMGCYKVFFTHGNEDVYVVKRWLKPELEATGASVFVDFSEISYGDNYRERIIGELTQCQELLVFLTPSAMRRPWIFAEIGVCIGRPVRIVVMTYGVTEAELQRLGILSLLGPNKSLKIDSFDLYLGELKQRVGELGQ